MGAASIHALIPQEEIAENVSHNTYHGNYINLVNITTTEWSPILNSDLPRSSTEQGENEAL